jgi:putative copper resistance protein D
MVNLVSDILHLVAAAAWVGGLVPLALLLREAGRPVVGPEAGGRGLGKMDAAALDIAREATRRFSTLGVASVGILVATGIVNSWILVGSLSDLVETDYGRFLVAKVALFLVMVAVAAFNRSRLTPQLLTGDARIAAPDALRLLRRNSLIEAAIAAAVLAIVGMLGTLPPGMHETG